jgi:hypothetical protein
MRRLIVVLAAALVLAGCGGGGSGSKSSTTTTAPTGTQVGPVVPGETLPSGGEDADPSARPLPWSAPTSGVVDLIQKANLPALGAEQLAYHIHIHLDVFYDGQAQVVPGQIGINYEGGVSISPLHTHDETGIVHVENETPTTLTLGQFFTEWNVRLDQTCVGSYCAPATSIAWRVDGKPFTGDPRTIELTKHREIALVIGKAPSSVPSSYDFPPNL